jgi:polar amino acid transport system substrate-binding protein
MKPSTIRYRRQLFTTAAVVTALVLAGCSSTASSNGSDETSSATTSAAGTPPKQQADELPPGGGIDPVSVSAAAIAKLPADFKSKGKIVVALTEQTPPSGFVGPDGKTIVGVDADLAALLSQKLGMPLEVQGTSFDQIIPGIEAGKYDMTIAAMSPTAAREKVLDFVDYFRTGSNVAVPPGNPKNLTLDNLCGQKIAVLKGSVQEGKIVPGLSKKCTDAGKPAIETSSFPDQQSTILALTSGRVDGVVQSAPPIAWAKKQGAAIDMAKQDAYTNVALGVKKGDGLAEVMSIAVQEIMDSPSYMQMLKKWGVSDNAIKEAKINNTVVF